MRRTVLWILGITLLAIAAVVAFELGKSGSKGNVWFAVPSASMSPTIKPGNHVLVDTYAYKTGSPAIGDIILFHPLSTEQCGAKATTAIKRIVATQGDTIASRGNELLVNGRVLPQRWPHVAQLLNPVVFQNVPPRHAFVMGDNEPLSCDSRYYGTVPYDTFVGKVVSIRP
jgi:signal peptidase I